MTDTNEAQRGPGSRFLILSRLDWLLEKSLFYVSGLLLIVIASAVIYTIIGRELNASPIWADEAPRVFFLWMTYLAIGVATKRDQNLRVTFFIELFGRRSRLYLELAMHALVIVMIIVLFWHNFPILKFSLGGRIISTGWSNIVSFLPLTVGCVLMVLYQTLLVRRSIRRYQGTLSREG